VNDMGVTRYVNQMQDVALELRRYACLAHTLHRALDHPEYGNEEFYGTARVLAHRLDDLANEVDELSTLIHNAHKEIVNAPTEQSVNGEE